MADVAGATVGVAAATRAGSGLARRGLTRLNHVFRHVNDIVAADTDEAEVEDFVDHYMFDCDAKGRPRKLPKHKWQFLARFVDRPASEDVWLTWAEADKLAALDRYSKLHPELKIPPDSASAVYARLEMNARDRD